MQTKKVIVFVALVILLAVPAFLALKTVRSEPSRGVQNTIIGNLFAAAVIADDTYILAGDRGRIFLTTDAGKNWKALLSTTGAPLVAISFPDEHSGWIVGQDGVVLHCADGGQTWVPQASGVQTYLLGVDFLDTLNGCAVGGDSTVIVTNDGGRSWQRCPFTLPAPPGEAAEKDMDKGTGEAFKEEFNLFAVKMLDAQQICIAGDQGRIFLTGDGGGSWTEAQSPLYDKEAGAGRTLYAIASDAGALSAVGVDSAYLISRDMGKIWTLANLGLKEPEFYAIDSIDGTGIAVGSGGNVIRTTDGGQTWQVLTVGDKITRAWLCAVDLKKTRAGDIRGIIAGQYGAVGIYSAGSLAWQMPYIPEER